MSLILSGGNPQLQDGILKIMKKKERAKEIFHAIKEVDENKSSLVELEFRNLDENSLETSEFAQTRKKNACTQTEFEDFVTLHLETLQNEFESERNKLEREITEEKCHMDEIIRQEYEQILKTKNYIINELTKENDVISKELKNLRVSKSVSKLFEATELQVGKVVDSGELADRHPVISSSYPKVPDNVDLSTVLHNKKGFPIQLIDSQKVDYDGRLEEEKTKLQLKLRREFEDKYKAERSTLLETIDTLKDGLEDMKTQKLELAKIFEGEKNALEFKFLIKEQKLKDKMKLDLQRKVIRAHREWTQTKL